MTSSNNPKKHWFALKVFYNKVFAIEEVLLKKNIECYIPCETVKVLKQDGTKKKCIDNAMRMIKAIVAVPEVGEVYKGKVRSIMPYGAFVEFLPGKDGLLHISEIDWKRLETVEEAGIKEGDEIDVKLLDIDPKTGKFKLSRKVLLPKPERQERPEKKDK